VDALLQQLLAPVRALQAVAAEAHAADLLR
jgi:hypothetical protein